MSYCMVLVTCSTESAARDLAGRIVKHKLAACAQIHPVTSIYNWAGQVHTDPEFRLIIKTCDSRYPELEAFLVQHHDYEVPQIVQVPITRGLETYLDWIDENTN